VIRNSIVTKLWLTIVAMVVLVLALLSILLQQFFDNYIIQQQTSQLSRLAVGVQSLMTNQDPDLSERIAEQVAQYVQHADIVFSVPFSSNQMLQQVYAKFTSTERSAFWAGKPIYLHGDTKGNQTVSVCIMLPSQGTPGMLDITQQMSVLDEPFTRMRNLIVFATGIGILLTTGLAFVVSKNLSRPLVQMNRVAEEMVKGNFVSRVSVVTRDEVGRLGNTFNTLASQLAQTIQALSLERDQLSSILSSLEDGVIAVDMLGNITLANPPALRRIQSLSLAETGAPSTERLPAEMKSLVSIVQKNKDVEVREVTWQGRDILITLIPLYVSGSNNLRGTLTVMHDVTEEHKLDRLRKDFIANVSHELRTPLSMMQGYAEALLDEFGDNPTQRRELTEIIHDESLRMKRLVNDLLDLAQLQSGQFKMQFGETDMPSLVRRVARKFLTIAQDREIQFEVNVPDDSVLVHSDTDRLEQVFTNLLDNAFRHTSASGSVLISMTTGTNHVRIRVADTGSGIPDADIPFIFERFYKADKARTRSVGGTGLGLSITRHIVYEHGGDIVVESNLGAGTVFTVVIPIDVKAKNTTML